MTIEQAKNLIPDKDYVIYRDEIRKFLEVDELMVKLFESDGLNLLALTSMCDTLGEYRGSFDSSVLPPYQEKDSVSIDVIILDKHGMMYIGFYDYNVNEWHLLTNQITEVKEFKWCFKPDYL